MIFEGEFLTQTQYAHVLKSSSRFPNDLTYFDNYRMRELKKKAEQQSMDAKQAAQRVGVYFTINSSTIDSLETIFLFL